MCTVLFLSIGCLFIYKKIAVYYNILANPDYRTLHESPKPRGGGLIFSLVFVFSILMFGLFPFWNVYELSNQIFFTRVKNWDG